VATLSEMFQEFFLASTPLETLQAQGLIQAPTLSEMLQELVSLVNTVQ
jgi:hypothetical protein